MRIKLINAAENNFQTEKVLILCNCFIRKPFETPLMWYNNLKLESLKIMELELYNLRKKKLLHS